MARILDMPNYICQAKSNFKNVRLAFMKSWNERLTFARKAAGLKQIELARAVGVSSASVSDWESGVVKNLEAPNLLKICEALNISPTWLQFGKGDMAHIHLTDDDIHALNINRNLGVKERRAWYRAGDSLAEPEEDEGTNGKQ